MRYEEIGLKPVPRTPLTSYVQMRIREAASHFVRITDWQETASRQISELTGSEAGIVLACPAAAFMLIASFYLKRGSSKSFFVSETHVDADAVRLCGGTVTRKHENAAASIISGDYVLQGCFHERSELPLIVLCTHTHTVGELRSIARIASALIIPGIFLNGPERSTAVACGHSMYTYLLETAAPCHGLGRSAKIGKEEIAGLIAAVEEYTQGACQ